MPAANDRTGRCPVSYPAADQLTSSTPTTRSATRRCRAPSACGSAVKIADSPARAWRRSSAGFTAVTQAFSGPPPGSTAGRSVIGCPLWGGRGDVGLVRARHVSGRGEGHGDVGVVPGVVRAAAHAARPDLGAVLPDELGEV